MEGLEVAGMEAAKAAAIEEAARAAVAREP